MRSSYSNTREISGWSPNPESTQNLLSPYPRWDLSEVSSMSFKVLIVDDEPDLEVLIRQRFRKKIKDGEFEFFFARNGQEALNIVKEDPELDVVMSDINMPVMDGLTLLSRLADVDRILKTVIVSAYGDMENIRAAMS